MSKSEARTLFTARGSYHVAVYSKAEDRFELWARKLFGPLEFRVRAWTLANYKAQELGFKPHCDL
jgi:hypothetical protein